MGVGVVGGVGGKGGGKKKVSNRGREGEREGEREEKYFELIKPNNVTMQTFPLGCVTALISFCLSECSLHHFTLVSVRPVLYAAAPYVRERARGEENELRERASERTNASPV